VTARELPATVQLYKTIGGAPQKKQVKMATGGSIESGSYVINASSARYLPAEFPRVTGTSGDSNVFGVMASGGDVTAERVALMPGEVVLPPSLAHFGPALNQMASGGNVGRDLAAATDIMTTIKEGFGSKACGGGSINVNLGLNDDLRQLAFVGKSEYLNGSGLRQ
jgi:hypothetical protein